MSRFMTMNLPNKDNFECVISKTICRFDFEQQPKIQQIYSHMNYKFGLPNKFDFPNKYVTPLSSYFNCFKF